MAGIDKIYGNKAQNDELKKWAEENRPDFVEWMIYPEWPDEVNHDSILPLTNLPSSIDRWLWANCPVKFVRDRLKEQYNIKEEYDGKFNPIKLSEDCPNWPEELGWEN